MPQARLQSSELIEKLSTLEIMPPNRFALSGIRNDALRLRSQDPAGAYVVLGILACIEEDPAEMRSNFEKALALASTNFENKGNYANSLARLGYFKEATARLIALHNASPDDLKTLKLALVTAIDSGELTVALELAKKAVRLHSPHGNAVETLSGVMALFSKDGIDETVFQRAIETAVAVAHESNTFRVFAKLALMHDDSEFVAYTLGVIRSPEQVADLNFKLAERFVDQLSDSIPPSLTVMFSSWAK